MRLVITNKGFYISGTKAEVLGQLELFTDRYLTLGELLGHWHGIVPKQ